MERFLEPFEQPEPLAEFAAIAARWLREWPSRQPSRAACHPDSFDDLKAALPSSPWAETFLTVSPLNGILVYCDESIPPGVVRFYNAEGVACEITLKAE